MCIYRKPSNRLKNLSPKNHYRRVSLLSGSVNRENFVEYVAVTRSEREVLPFGIPEELRELDKYGTERWAVVLFNDEHHSMDYVVWALLKIVPELSIAEATLIMMETHNTGKGVVILCDRNQAIEYRNSFRTLQLNCDVEPGW
tara:strand:- start:1103 stop:1531 length:429 start_codon:yes stop_codon:yes gene_type:complete